MRTQFDRTHSERGAVLVHVAVNLLGLMALTTFVVGYGVMWSSRRQSQNAADAAALAGATALAFDSNDTSTTGVAYLSAKKVVESSRVWGEQPGYVITINTSVCPPEFPGVCVKVDVHRDGTNGSNTLPMFFGYLIGRTSQTTKATATAQVLIGNSTDCLKPWGVVDKWAERAP